METGLIYPAELEVRQSGGRGRQLAGRFEYGDVAVTASRGRQRKEIMAPRAFSYSVSGEGRDREINLLVGHDLNRPLASRNNGTLKLRETDKALSFTADLTPERSSPSWVNDAWAAVSSGLMVGLSPGFTVPDNKVVPGAEELIPEPGTGGKILQRLVRHAVLWELSATVRGAYKAAKIGKRSEAPPPASPDFPEVLAWL